MHKRPCFWKLFGNERVNKFLLVARKHDTYISQFVCAFVQITPYKVDDDAKNLLRYFCQATIDIHQGDIRSEAASSITDSCNPPKFGQAHYFNKEGTQIRETRKFECDNAKIGDLTMKHAQRNILRLQKEVLPFYFCGFVHCTGIATETIVVKVEEILLALSTTILK